MKTWAVKVEDGRVGRSGEPSVGPVYRNVLSKDGFPPLDVGMSTSWELFRTSVEKFPSNRMLGWREFVNGKPGIYLWKTYEEVHAEVLNIGSALRQLGAEPASRIGIYGENCPQWIVAMQACNGYSFSCVPLYDTLGVGAVSYIIEHADINFVFVQDKKLKALLSSDIQALRRVKSIISFSLTTNAYDGKATDYGTKLYSWNDFLQLGKDYPAEPLPPRPLDICTIMYTSGTSGNPKGVVLTHESLAYYIKGMNIFLDQFEDKMTTDDVYLSFLPLAHILDRMIEEIFFCRGASVGYYHGNINALRDDLAELKPTLFVGVPRAFEKVHEGVLKALQVLRPLRRMIFNILYKHKLSWMRYGYSHKTASPLADLLAFRKVKDRLGGRIRLMISGGAPMSPEIEEFMRVTSCAFFIQGYGLTETCGGTTVGWPDDMSLLNTVGTATMYTELRLEEVSEMGYDPLGVPSRGEICLKGKNLFSGYYKDPELTKEAIKDGWFHTGDIGELSPEGVLKIIDRKKNIFKLSQGEYVAAEHLEKIYRDASIIEDIWVYGDSFQSMLVAVITPHEENTTKWAKMNGYVGTFPELCSLEELKHHILAELKAVAEKNRLRGFEHIRGIVVDPVPFNIERNLITATMKKIRAQMLKYYHEDVENLYKVLTVEKK